MSVRQEKVQEQLVHEISQIIRRDLRDPRLGFVTLTGAEISRDLRHAKIFISVLGDDEARKQTLKALNGAVGLLRGEFARRAHLRVAPELEFRFDEGIERGQRIFELLHSVESDLQPHPETSAEPNPPTPLGAASSAPTSFASLTGKGEDSALDAPPSLAKRSERPGKGAGGLGEER